MTYFSSLEHRAETRTSYNGGVDRAVYELAGDEVFVRVEGWQVRADGEQYCTFSQPLFVIYSCLPFAPGLHKS